MVEHGLTGEGQETWPVFLCACALAKNLRVGRSGVLQPKRASTISGEIQLSQ